MMILCESCQLLYIGSQPVSVVTADIVIVSVWEHIHFLFVVNKHSSIWIQNYIRIRTEI